MHTYLVTFAQPADNPHWAAEAGRIVNMEFGVDVMADGIFQWNGMPRHEDGQKALAKLEAAGYVKDGEPSIEPLAKFQKAWKGSKHRKAWRW